MSNRINWEEVVRRHASFIKAGRSGSFENGELSLCLKDGCGTACFHGEDSWEQAADFLGFTVTLEEWRPDPVYQSQYAYACGYHD